MKNSIDYISIKGFRSIKDIDKLNLGQINILIGANGSGKSNFISVFEFLNIIRRGVLRKYTEKKGGASKILHFGSKRTSAIIIEISFRNSTNGYQLTLSPNDLDLLYILEEYCWFWKKERYADRILYPLKSIDGEAGISKQLSSASKWVQLRLESWKLYHFHDTSESSPMKLIADIDDNHFLRPNGANLPAYLLFLKEKYSSYYDLICKIVRRVTPFFMDFQLAPLRLNEDKIRLEWIHKESDDYFDASSLSDGTLRFICLATLLLQPPKLRPSMILLDEPELGLHPYAISMLANMIKSASVETQVILSTQSPLLLDNFAPEDILVAELKNGETHLNRLNIADLDTWLEDYSLGELWEKNQLGGRPNNV